MNHIDYDLLEKLNSEKIALIKSPEFQRILFRRAVLNLLKKGQFQAVFQLFKKQRKKKSMTGLQELTYKRSSKNGEDEKSARIAVYSFARENEAPADHLVHFDNADFILFALKPEKYYANKAYDQIRPIPENLAGEGMKDACSYIQKHPAEFFKGYDFAIYLDPDVRAMGDIRRIIRYISSDSGLAFYPCKWSDDLYQSSALLKSLEPKKSDTIDLTISRYKNNGFPGHFGLFDTRVFAADLKSARALMLLDAWYKEELRSTITDDSISLPFVLWENDVLADEIGLIAADLELDPLLEVESWHV